MTTLERLEEIEARQKQRFGLRQDELEFLLTTLRQQLVVNQKAKEAMKRGCDCEKLHPDIGGKCWACSELAEIKKLEQAK